MLARLRASRPARQRAKASMAVGIKARMAALQQGKEDEGSLCIRKKNFFPIPFNDVSFLFLS
jgi:hypothetical protein